MGGIPLFSKETLNKINTNDKILIVGDILLDQYIYGESTRLSPEAPIPIFVPQKSSFRLGGAANVFNIVNALNGNAKLCGIVGNDLEGNCVKNYLSELNEFGELIIGCARPTTTKTRLICGKQHMLRIDREEVHEIDSELENRIIELIQDNINNYKVLILSDYHKGFLSYGLVKRVVKICNDNNVKILVDAKKDFLKYKNSFLIKPNIKDLINIMGCSVHFDRNELILYCKKLLYKGNFKYIYVTLGENGGILIDEKNETNIRPFLNEFYVDATGAGDTAIAALSVALAANLEIDDAMFFASYVAGISITKNETNGVTKEDLLRYVRYI